MKFLTFLLRNVRFIRYNSPTDKNRETEYIRGGAPPAANIGSKNRK